MALTPKAPDGGLLQDTTGDVFTATERTVFVRGSIVLVNTDSAARTFNLYTRVDGATDRNVSAVDQEIQPGATWLNPGPIFLEVGDKLRGDADVTNKVSFALSSLEKT